MTGPMRAGLAGGLLVATLAGVAAQTPPSQRFEARADSVLVDVAVLDNQGRPVRDLEPEDFTLQVEGGPRPIQSLQFLSTLSAGTPPPTPREQRTSSNVHAGSGRLILLAVDEGHLRVGANRAVLRAAEGLLDRLGAADMVGLARLPTGTGGVEFTTNRNLIREALKPVTGAYVRPPTAETVHLSEAHDFVHGTRDGWPQVLARECPPPDDRMYEACVAAAESSARQVVDDREQRASATIRVLDQLAERLRPLNVPVSLILISEGLYVGPTLRPEVERLGARAAAARVSLYIVRPAGEFFDIAQREAGTDRAQDERLTRDGLEQLAGRMRGALFSAAGGGNNIFERINAELSGYYLLAFEPTADDRSGRERRIRVEVKRRGVTVRARSSFAIRAAAETAPVTPESRLQQALMAPLPLPGLPIRVADYRVVSAEEGKVRVLIGAEIGEGAREAATLPVGLLVLDRSGTPVTSHLGEAEMKPTLVSAPSPRLFLTSVVVPPGDYTVRLASAGADGAIGSVHHSFSARLHTAAGGLALSDLIVTGASAGADGLRPLPSAVIEGDRALLLLDAEQADPAALARVTVAFEILRSSRDTPLAGGAAQAETRANGRQRSFAAAVSLAGVTPGEYIVRARVEAPDRQPTVIDRPIRVEGAPKTAAAGAASAIVRKAPPAPARILLPMLRVRAADFLRPEIVNPFLDYLQATVRPTDAVRPLVEQARKGNFQPRQPSSGGDDVIVSFVNGLAALEQNQIPQAMTMFQRTLRGAPDFVGVAFFLGASHAAAGRDREAAGAWQMALLSKEAEPAHAFMVDALLRVGEGQRAIDAIGRSPEAWRGSAAAAERSALAEAVAGRFAEALPRLEALLAARPNDLDLLFVAIHTLYRQHLQEPLTGPALARFDEWTARYGKAAGNDRPSIAPWRQYVLP